VKAGEREIEKERKREREGEIVGEGDNLKTIIDKENPI
jgi:hypothetical protein